MRPEEKAHSKDKETVMSTKGSEAGSEMRGVDQARRALIRAGWVVPFILAVQLPTDAFAQPIGQYVD